MKRFRLYIVLALAALAVACAEEEPKRLLPEFETFNYEAVDEGRYNISISYERITNTRSSEAFRLIDSMNYHATFGDFAALSDNPQYAAELMATDLLSNMMAFEFRAAEYTMHLYQVASLVRDETIVCYDTYTEMDLGDVYPTVSQTYECYDIATGNAYDFSYLAEGEWSDELNALLFEKLVAEYGDGLMIDSAELLHIPEAIFLTDSGIVFQYQPYEIGDASLGSASIEITDRELREVGAPIVWE